MRKGNADYLCVVSENRSHELACVYFSRRLIIDAFASCRCHRNPIDPCSRAPSFLPLRAFLTRGDVAEMEDIADEVAASLAAENATPLEVRRLHARDCSQ